MSMNDINSNNQENPQNGFQYYSDKLSENIEYEDVDSFSQSRDKQYIIEMENNELNINSNNNFINNNTNDLTKSNLNVALTNIISNMNNSNSNNLLTNTRSNININIPTNNIRNSNQINDNINNILDSSGVENYSSELNGNDDNSNSHNNNNNNTNFENQLDDIFDQMSYAISSQKQSLKNDKDSLIKDKNKFSEFKKAQICQLEQEKENWKQNFKKIENLKVKETDIIDLDIGGTHKITTTRSTLLKYPNSALALMFSGKHHLQKINNRYFVDRDGHNFVNLINFLRSGKFPIFKNKLDESAFLGELEFWNINFSENKQANLKFDPEWVASSLFLDNNNLVIRKQSLQHGIVFINTPLDINNSYIEFKVTMLLPSRGKNHLFIGVVDKSKYKKENLISTFWKDSPSSFYWDVWNTKLIKTDENGLQTGSIESYGCQCEGNETSIGMFYNYKNKTLIFYKNGINQGIAFTKVPSGLTPSLDIWFESGTVEILRKCSPEDKIFL